MSENILNVVPIHTWEFDNYSSEHWEEIKAGLVDKTKSYVQLSDVDKNFGLGCQRLEVFLNKEVKLAIEADRDQWGTWITFNVGDQSFTVAQEDQTMSFVDSLIEALTEFKKFTDFETLPGKQTKST